MRPRAHRHVNKLARVAACVTILATTAVAAGVIDPEVASATTTNPLAFEWNVWGNKASEANHTFNLHVIGDVENAYVNNPSLFTFGLVEICSFQATEIQNWLNNHGAPVSLSTYFEEPVSSGGCNTGAPPGAPPVQQWGDAVLSRGTRDWYASTHYSDYYPPSNHKDGYVCARVHAYFAALTCVTHLHAGSGSEKWNEVQEYDDFIRSYGTGVSLPFVMGDLNFIPNPPPGSTRDVLVDFFYGYGSMPSMTETEDKATFGATCPGTEGWYYTCRQPHTFQSGTKIDYIWMADSMSPKLGIVDNSPWSGIAEAYWHSDHSMVYAGN